MRAESNAEMQTDWAQDAPGNCQMWIDINVNIHRRSRGLQRIFRITHLTRGATHENP